MKKKIFLIVLIYLILDFTFVNFFLKKINLWQNYKKNNVYWRVQSEIYDHDFSPMIEAEEKWQNFKKKIITNSLAYRDEEKRIVKKISNKKRLLIIGDSFIEGAGYNYEDTLAGLLTRENKNNLEILNAGVNSYSAGPYFLKINHLLNKGYKIDYALIFLDVSDIYDELFYFYSKDNKKIINYQLATNHKKKHFLKTTFYKLGDTLIDNTILFKVLLAITDQTEIFKNYIKLRIKASKEFNKSFLKTSTEDTLFYRMLSVDRGSWTQNELKYNNVIQGIDKTKFFLKKLFILLNENQIRSSLVIYPWPNQIFYGDKFHQKIWHDFSKENNINFINLYSAFNDGNKRKIIMDNFILGDIHWNKAGTRKVFNELIKNEFYQIIKKENDIR